MLSEEAKLLRKTEALDTNVIDIIAKNIDDPALSD